jgi:chromosome segregation ATPase
MARILSHLFAGKPTEAPHPAVATLERQLTAATAVADSHRQRAERAEEALDKSQLDQEQLAADLAELRTRLEAATAATTALEASIPDRVKAEAINLAASAGIPAADLPAADAGHAETVDSLRAKLAAADPREKYAIASQIRALRTPSRN